MKPEKSLKIKLLSVTTKYWLHYYYKVITQLNFEVNIIKLLE